MVGRFSMIHRFSKNRNGIRNAENGKAPEIHEKVPE
jgi:hypothetical protein